MDGIEAHRRFERLLADALVCRDPSAALARAQADPELPPALKEAIAGADPDGVALTALLVAKLRFERLIRGSSRVGEWFDRDPRGFTEAFRRYHAEVAPTTSEPGKEVRFFEGWLAARGVDPGGF